MIIDSTLLELIEQACVEYNTQHEDTISVDEAISILNSQTDFLQEMLNQDKTIMFPVLGSFKPERLYKENDL